jgi:pyruvate ferredoxin oxidoreductase beta subunit
MPNAKTLAEREDRFVGGHRACSGCGFPIAVRLILKATELPIVAGSATGCLSVTSSIFPYTAWNMPFIHSAFENVAATISGVEAAYRVLRKKGAINKEIRFIAFGGDGGTYDIGIQSLSGALERGHRMLYVCYDNGAYANTGIQRSGATPRGANTTTSPAGKVKPGKTQPRKDLTEIVIAHHIPYVAQASVAHWNDLVAKTEKALNTDGPSFINVMAPCRLSWGIDPNETVEIVRQAVDCCCWPLFEVENGRWKLSYRPKEKGSYIDWLKRQNRFRHLFKPGQEPLLEELQAEVDQKWAAIVERCGE